MALIHSAAVIEWRKMGLPGAISKYVIAGLRGQGEGNG